MIKIKIDRILCKDITLIKNIQLQFETSNDQSYITQITNGNIDEKFNFNHYDQEDINITFLKYNNNKSKVITSQKIFQDIDILEYPYLQNIEFEINNQTCLLFMFFQQVKQKLIKQKLNDILNENKNLEYNFEYMLDSIQKSIISNNLYQSIWKYILSQFQIDYCNNIDSIRNLEENQLKYYILSKQETTHTHLSNSNDYKYLKKEILNFPILIQKVIFNIEKNKQNNLKTSSKIITKFDIYLDRLTRQGIILSKHYDDIELFKNIGQKQNTGFYEQSKLPNNFIVGVNKHNKNGGISFIFEDSWQQVGFINNDLKYHGEGLLQQQDNYISIMKFGIWENGQLVRQCQTKTMDEHGVTTQEIFCSKIEDNLMNGPCEIQKQDTRREAKQKKLKIFFSIRGMYHQGKLDGIGFIFRNGNFEEGFFSKDLKEGQIVKNQEDGSQYEGMYKDNQKHGQGAHFQSEGQAGHWGQQKGEWANNLQNGFGFFKWIKTGECQEGFWRKHKMDGQGKLVSNNDVYYGDFEGHTLKTKRQSTLQEQMFKQLKWEGYI